jgi:hypothetical protein
MNSGIDAGFEYCWVRDHWWGSYHELRTGSGVVASIRAKGSSGVAQISSRRYDLVRSAWPADITLSSAGTGEPIARLALLPKPWRAEFADGDSFSLGWVKFWKREWAWTREDGDIVLLITRLGLRHGPGGYSKEKLALLAILQRAIGVLAKPLL